MGCSSSQQHRTKVKVIMTLGNNICQQLIQLKNYIMYHNNLAKNKPRLCIIYTLKVLIYIDNNIMIQNQISCEAKNYNTKQKIYFLLLDKLLPDSVMASSRSEENVVLNNFQY